MPKIMIIIFIMTRIMVFIFIKNVIKRLIYPGLPPFIRLPDFAHLQRFQRLSNNFPFLS